MRVQGVGLRVWVEGSGLSVQVSGFLGLRVQGLGVQGLGFLHLRFRLGV